MWPTRNTLVLGTLVLAALLAPAPSSYVVAAIAHHGSSAVLAPATSDGSWLDRINAIRTASGLPTVTDNPTWTSGISNHLTYLEKTPSSYRQGQYASAHTENPQSPYYTASGAREGGSSDLEWGANTDLGAINYWLAAPFHAIGMLRPGLRQVAFARHASSNKAGLDVLSGLQGSSSQSRVEFPGPGSTIDLGRYSGGESPSPIETCTTDKPGADYSAPGLPLIALLTQPPTSDLSATLTRPDGSVISSTNSDLCMVDENNYTSNDSVYGPTGKAILQGDRAVFIVPRTPLTAGQYTVNISQGGQPDISWTFTFQPSAQSPSYGYGVVCSNTNGHTGSLEVTISNPDEGAGPASYQVTAAKETQRSPSVADGASTSVAFNRLPAGSLDLAIVGSDGSSQNFSVRVPGCPAYTAVRVHFGTLHRRARYIPVSLDNSANAQPTTFVVRGTGVQRVSVKMPGAATRRIHVRVARHHFIDMQILVNHHQVAREVVHS